MIYVAKSQHLDITCNINSLPDVIRFAFDLAGCTDMLTRKNNRVKVAYQYVPYGKYLVLTTGSMAGDDGTPAGGLPAPEFYTDMEDDYAPKNLAKFIEKYVLGIPRPAYERGLNDAGLVTGVRVRSICSLLRDEPENHHIMNPDDAGFVIQPWLI